MKKFIQCDQSYLSACPVTTTLKLIGGKWKILILWQLSYHVLRFTDLANLLPGISKKVLSTQLKELEEDGLIHRTSYPEIPPRVEYSISKTGNSLEPVLQTICEWGNSFLAAKK